MSDSALRYSPCPACGGAQWVWDASGEWIRCVDCNKPVPPKAKATVLTFARGARVRKPVEEKRDAE